MSVKPTALAAILGQKPEPLRDPGKPNANQNRFALLRDRSRSLSVGQSSKRRLEDGEDPNGKQARVDRNAKFEQMSKVEDMVKKGKESVVAMMSNCEKADMSQDIKKVISSMLDFMGHMVDTVEALASTVVDSVDTSSKVKVAQAVPTEDSNTTAPKQLDESEVKKRKFVQAVREAEKSVLVFDLDLGRVPIMNKNTLSTNVTKDITAKAAVVDGQLHGRPKEDTVAVLEDTLSMMKGMDFFGKVTKPNKARTGKEEDNGKFHTMPVSMVFKDKDSKVRAEQVLRKHCKLQCATPYPQRLRQEIKKVLDQQKELDKDSFVQIRVDTESMALKVSRKKDGQWQNNVAVIAIPEEVIDLGRTGNKPQGGLVEGAPEAL